MAEPPRTWTTIALLPLAAGLGVVMLEAVRQIESPTTRAIVAGTGLVLTYLLGLGTRAADLKFSQPKRKRAATQPDSDPPPTVRDL